MATATATTPAAVTAANSAVVNRILATIRKLESGGNYTAQNKHSSASGAYQFIDSTWNNYGGYKHAKDAPPSVQDARARADVQRILASYNGDVSVVPQYWYYPAGIGKPDLVPPGANSLSMGEYTKRWLGIYKSVGGQDVQYNPGVGSLSQWEKATGNETGTPRPRLNSEPKEEGSGLALAVLTSIDDALNAKGGALLPWQDAPDLALSVLTRTGVVIVGSMLGVAGGVLLVSALLDSPSVRGAKKVAKSVPGVGTAVTVADSVSGEGSE